MMEGYGQDSMGKVKMCILEVPSMRVSKLLKFTQKAVMCMIYIGDPTVDNCLLISEQMVQKMTIFWYTASIRKHPKT